VTGGGFRKLCAAYLHRDDARALVVSLHGGAPYYEDEAVSEITTADRAALGEVVKSAFEASTQRERPGGYRDIKRSDWPTFKASGFRAINRFERDFVRYAIEGLNPSNAVASLTSPEIADGISLTATCNPKLGPELGKLLMNLHTHFLRWQGGDAERPA
jgi:hypothetical protein